MYCANLSLQLCAIAFANTKASFMLVHVCVRKKLIIKSGHVENGLSLFYIHSWCQQSVTTSQSPKDACTTNLLKQ